MTIQLDHVIVPSHHRVSSAKLLADLLGVAWEESRGEFTPVYVNESLTLDFAERDQFQRPPLGDSHRQLCSRGVSFGRGRRLAFGAGRRSPAGVLVSTIIALSESTCVGRGGRGGRRRPD